MGDNFKKLKDTWEKEVYKIENNPIDANGTRLIYNKFEIDKINLIQSLPKNMFTHDMVLEIDLLESKLASSLAVAKTKYKLQERNYLVKIIEAITELIITIKEAIKRIPRIPS